MESADSFEAERHDSIGGGSTALATVKEENGQAPGHGPGWVHDDSEDEAEVRPVSKRQRTGFLCQACNMSFTEKRALARHKKTDHHRKQLGLPPDRRHVCSLCGKCFTRGHDLKRHQTEQHKEQSSSVVAEGSCGSSDGGTEKTPSEEPPSFPSALQSSPETSLTTSLTDPSLSLSPEDAELLEIAYPYVPSSYDRFHYEQDTIMPDAGPRSHSPKRIQGFPTLPDDILFHQYAESVETTVSPGRSETSSKIKSPKSPLLSGKHFFTAAPAKRPSDPDLNRRMPHGRAPNITSAPWQPLICALCNDAFEEDSEELLKHLKRHLDGFKARFRCNDCQIDFVHQQDLDKHFQSAATGHCGFSFPHSCTGHHPPAVDVSPAFSDYDRVRLCVQLQNWEQAQLDAYIEQINDLTSSRQTRKLTRWSEVLRGSSRRNSFASFAISINSYATAPCDVTDGKTDIGGLQKRLQQMSLGKSASSRVRRLVNPGGIREDLRTRTVDRSLQKAVKHNDVHKAEKLLDIGGDACIVHETDGPFIAKALWGHGLFSSLLSEHRIGEDIMGGCSVCGLASESFGKGTNKIKALLRHNADPNLDGGLRGFPLSTAAWMGKPEVVKLLLDHGADVHKQGGKFGNALCAAASEAGYAGHTEVIRLLVGKGANVASSGPEGSALDLAKKRREQCIARLMQPAESRDRQFKTTLTSCDEIIRILERQDLPTKNYQPAADPVLADIYDSSHIKPKSHTFKVGSWADS